MWIIKMLISIDTETYKKDEEGLYKPILDATGDNYIIGCLQKENGGKKAFKDKGEMWEYIKNLAEKEFKRGKKLTIYAHNTRYEFFQIVDYANDKNVKIFSENPFIASYYKDVEKEFLTKEEFESWKKWASMNVQLYEVDYICEDVTIVRYRKEIIKFLDTIALFHMSLEKVGKLIDVPKTEMPIDLGKKITKEKMKILKEYCLNDCKVSLEAVRFLKNKLKEDGINIRNLCTINQIAISYLINELRKDERNEHILTRNYKGELTENTWKTYFPEEIHQAYRGGFVRVWKTGKLEGLTDIDYNSLYPTMAMKMKFPDLRTETKIKEPLKIFSEKELFRKIGLSKCLVYNESDELGLLLCRMEGKSYVFGKGKYSIGVWTNVELEEAIKNGYKILDVEWSIVYQEGYNPFKDIFKKIYEKRKNSGTKFDNYFYKMIMNAGIGKFAQTKVNQEILMDSIEMINKYLEEGYEILANIEDSPNVLYINKDITNGKKKKYYAPIISCLITANSRVEMYKKYKLLPIDSLVYSDTDSIIFKGKGLENFKLGNELGEFKVEKDIETDEELINVSGLIWGTKCKMIGNNIGVSGVFKGDLNKENFEKGVVQAKRMMGIKNKMIKRAGEFVVEARDLRKQLEDFKKSEEKLKDEMLYIDKGLKDISYFAESLKRLELTNVIH